MAATSQRVPAVSVSHRAALVRRRDELIRRRRPRPRAEAGDLGRTAVALLIVLVGGSVVIGAGTSISMAAGVGALVAAAALLCVIRRPLTMALILVAAPAVTSGLRSGLPVPGFRISELLTAVLATLILVFPPGHGRVRWRLFDWVALAYVLGSLVIGALDLHDRGGAFNSSDLDTIIGPVQFFLLYRAVMTAVDSPRRRALALRWVAIASAPVSVLTIGQYAKLPEFNTICTWLTGVNYAGQSYSGVARATGPFPNWQVTSGYLFMAGLVLVALLLDTQVVPVLRRRWLGLLLALCCGALLCTGTATTSGGFVVGALVLGAWYRKGGRVLAVFGVGAVAAVPLFSHFIDQRVSENYSTTVAYSNYRFLPQSLAYRLTVWTQQYLPALKGKWLLGYGPALPPGVTFAYSESLYLTLLLRGGVLLLAIYALMVAALLAETTVFWRGGSGLPEQAAGRVMVVATVLLIPMQLLLPYFITSGLPQLWWLLAGICLAPLRHQSRSIRTSDRRAETLRRAAAV